MSSFRDLQKIAKGYGIPITGKGVNADWLREQISTKESEKTKDNLKNKELNPRLRDLPGIEEEGEKDLVTSINGLFSTFLTNIGLTVSTSREFDFETISEYDFEAYFARDEDISDSLKHQFGGNEVLNFSP